MTDKIYLKEAVIVEGRYDRVRLSGFIASPVIETGGFRVFKDKEKQALIRAIAERRGVLIMTDVDSAGFVIRNFLRGIIPQEKILHAYIPTVPGKERRKPEPSKEGVLGVEGLDSEALLKAIRESGAHIESDPLSGAEPSNRAEQDESQRISKSDFYSYGMTGTRNAAARRSAVLSDLGLPRYLTPNAMISALNCLFTKPEFEAYLDRLGQID